MALGYLHQNTFLLLGRQMFAQELPILRMTYNLSFDNNMINQFPGRYGQQKNKKKQVQSAESVVCSFEQR